jgi:hypothetical protein
MINDDECTSNILTKIYVFHAMLIAKKNLSYLFDLR